MREYTVEQIAEIDKRIKEERKEAATKAREDVLNKLKDELIEMGCMGDICCRDYLKQWAEKQSLRHHQDLPHPPPEHQYGENATKEEMDKHTTYHKGNR